MMYHMSTKRIPRKTSGEAQPHDAPNACSAGQALRYVRKIMGLSQSQMASLARVSKGYLWEMEKDRRCDPGLEVLNRLLSTCGMHLQICGSIDGRRIKITLRQPGWDEPEGCLDEPAPLAVHATKDEKK